MSPFQRSVLFSSADMAYLRQHNVKLAGKVFQEAMKFAVDNQLQAFSTVEAKSWSQLDEAMMMVQDNKHIGKVVLVPSKGDFVLVIDRLSAC